jgi:hypothetical protein
MRYAVVVPPFLTGDRPVKSDSKHCIRWGYVARTRLVMVSIRLVDI